jgi:hypothetical protein
MTLAITSIPESLSIVQGTETEKYIRVTPSAKINQTFLSCLFIPEADFSVEEPQLIVPRIEGNTFVLMKLGAVNNFLMKQQVVGVVDLLDISGTYAQRASLNPFFNTVKTYLNSVKKTNFAFDEKTFNGYQKIPHEAIPDFKQPFLTLSYFYSGIVRFWESQRGVEMNRQNKENFQQKQKKKS